MKHYFDNVVNQANVPVPGATVAVFLTGTQTLASLFSDDGLTPSANPLTTKAPASGSPGAFDFYIADGRYDLRFSGVGIATFTQQNVEIADITEAGPGVGDLP